MTAQSAVSRQKERGQGAYINLRAVILATPVITASGWGDGGDGNPEEQRRSTLIFPLHIEERRAQSRYWGKSENNTLFYWIPEQARE